MSETPKESCRYPGCTRIWATRVVDGEIKVRFPIASNTTLWKNIAPIANPIMTCHSQMRDLVIFYRQLIIPTCFVDSVKIIGSETGKNLTLHLIMLNFFGIIVLEKCFIISSSSSHPVMSCFSIVNRIQKPWLVTSL